MLFRRKLDISALKEFRPKASKTRSSTSIVVIDDEPEKIQDWLDSLRANNFVLTQLDDVTDVKVLGSYDVVICDIAGVGKALRSRFQGAHLIEEISKEYPFKYLIAHTSKPWDQEHQSRIQLCDLTRDKGHDIASWCDWLDQAISELSDPSAIWKKARRHLERMQYPLEAIARVEAAFVKGIKKKDASIVAKVLGSRQGIGETVVASVISGLAQITAALVKSSD